MEEESTGTILTLLDRKAKLNPRQIRANGFIPVTVYGKKLAKSLSLKIEKETYRKRKLNKLVGPIKAVYNGDNYTLLIKSIERHPFKENLIYNIQFHSVEPEDQVQSFVPIETKGSSDLIKIGGLLLMNKTVVLIKCKVAQIPESLKADLSILAGSRNCLYFSDLEVPSPEIKVLNRPSEVIATVSMPRVSADNSTQTTEKGDKTNQTESGEQKAGTKK